MLSGRLTTGRVLPALLLTGNLMSILSYLALDMEEDYEDPKEAILSFLFGKNNCPLRPLFHKLRFQFFCALGWRARVTREECEEVGGLWD